MVCQLDRFRKGSFRLGAGTRRAASFGHCRQSLYNHAQHRLVSVKRNEESKAEAPRPSGAEEVGHVGDRAVGDEIPGAVARAIIAITKMCAETTSFGVIRVELRPSSELAT